MNDIAFDREFFRSCNLIYNNNFIFNLGIKIFVICKQSIDKNKKLSRTQVK
jgi:hypothetical protein